MKFDARTWLMLIAAVLIAFLIGYGWQRIRANSIDEQRATAERALEVQRIESTLGAAAIEAQRGSYEVARQHASDFFTDLQAEVDSMPQAAQPEMRALLGHRDVIITALSRSDPQSGPQLAQMFVRYRTALGEPVGPRQNAAPVPVPLDTAAVPADTAA
jgi:hypothetical protein